MRRLIVLVVFSLLASSGPLNAHSPLSSSVPQNGAKLTAYPSDVQLTFKHPVIVTKLTLIHKDGGGGETHSLAIAVQENEQDPQCWRGF